MGRARGRGLSQVPEVSGGLSISALPTVALGKIRPHRHGAATLPSKAGRPQENARKPTRLAQSLSQWAGPALDSTLVLGLSDLGKTLGPWALLHHLHNAAGACGFPTGRVDRGHAR